MKKLKVLVTDPIDEEGLRPLRGHPGIELSFALKPSPETLEKALVGTDAWLVRSETKVTAPWIEKAPALRLIGRAGVGVDNIDMDAATRRGIAVINAPAANTIAAAEHTFGMMLALARKIPQADADVKAGHWRRAHWMGSELMGKTLGVVGLGRIGREVARRALAFGMGVMAFDPFVSAEQARELGVALADLKTLLGAADFVTLHAPGSDKTRHLVNADTIAWFKPGARLVNCARGELIDSAALAEAIKNGRIAGAALDVFEKEPLPLDSPLRGLAEVILTPHLGASTVEAQGRVATELSEGVLAFLERGIAVNALNLPGFDMETLKSLGDFLELAEKMGRFLGQTIDSGLREVHCAFAGGFTPAQRRPLAVAALKGLLGSILSHSVTYISAPALAADRGVRTSSTADPRAREGFRQLMTVTAVTDKGSSSVSGSVLSPGEPRLVRIGELAVEVKPEGKMLVLTNEDTPGMIGRVGTLLGDAGVNIADMRVGRRSARGDAVMALTLDEEIAPELRAKLQATPGIKKVRWVKL